jgi:hypothetical protein
MMFQIAHWGIPFLANGSSQVANDTTGRVDARGQVQVLVWITRPP